MEQGKKKEGILLKTRSGQACIREGYHLFTTHFRRIFRYTWPVALCFAVLSATAAALPVLISPTLLLPALLIDTIAIILLLTSAYRLLVKRQLFERLPKNESKQCWVWFRHLGTRSLVWTFCLLVVLLLSIITVLPMLIVLAANWLNQDGILKGDPNGMPDYMTWLTIFVFLIAGFIQAYVWLTLLGPLYLMQSSVVQQEKEREILNKKTQKKPT